MYTFFKATSSLLLFFMLISCNKNTSENSESAYEEPQSETEESADQYNEEYRNQFHFSPPEKWMNDPNGMVLHNGVYHLFYQYYPDSTVWGPMHWGHATSRDLLYWENKPVALFPDSLGYIFSGSTVLDKENTSGLGTKDTPPLIALFTYHDPEKERAGSNVYQYQGLSYSLDDGKTWKKYESNPVLENPGIKDFRDPKVFWHEPGNQWIMVLAVLDHVEFYGSKNLLSWTKLSEFGRNEGSHDGVWECPDLIEVPVENSQNRQWVLLVSIGTGGERGSATQYFIGDFDGEKFVNKYNENKVLWLDQGWDNYAGVTWSNTPDDQKIFLGWMSNWLYAQEVPTVSWRSHMTVPRKLTVFNSQDFLRLRSYPVLDFQLLRKSAKEINRTLVNIEADFSQYLQGDGMPLFDFELLFSRIRNDVPWSVVFSNVHGDTLEFGYDNTQNRYFLDRSRSGEVSFHEKFGQIHRAERLNRGPQFPVRILLDRSSIEVFADKGEVVFSDIFFPKGPLTFMHIRAPEEAILFEGMVYRMKSIWKEK